MRTNPDNVVESLKKNFTNTSLDLYFVHLQIHSELVARINTIY